MRYPKLKETACTRRTVDTFRGYNRGAVIGPGEFADMENLTSDAYPVLSVRPGRSFYRRPASPQGLTAGDVLCYVDGRDFVAGDTVVPMELSVAEADCPKDLVSMGAYVIILPDKKYINTQNLEDFGNIEAVFTAEGATVEADTEAGFCRICAAGIGKAFRPGDAVTLEGLAILDGTVTIRDCGDDHLLVPGEAEAAVTGSVRISRRMPRLDFAVECGNRLWGCRYGPDEQGSFVNEIYASALGDFKNWYRFDGLSTDSYAASCGSDGPFTGAAVYLGAPLFFKENGVHKVYGSYPAAFRIQYTACRGVESGCGRSLALVHETLFYKSRSGICAYDGSLPVCVSEALGKDAFSDAVAGSVDGKYYVSMKDGAGAYHLFVFDTGRGLWHREDGFHASSFCTHRGRLYAVDAESRDIFCMTGGTEPVRWMARTGDLGLSEQGSKYVSRLAVRLALQRGAQVVISVSYDREDRWEPLCKVFGTRLRSVTVPLRLRRCDTFRLRFEGEGQAWVYAVTEFLHPEQV